MDMWTWSAMCFTVIAAYLWGFDNGVDTGCKLTVEKVAHELTAGTMTLKDGKIKTVKKEDL